jgi:seryl-tRNA synthetase
VIDVRLLRDDPAYRRGVVRKGCDQQLVEAVLEADERHRALLAEVEDLRAEHNRASKAIADAAPEDRPAKIEAASGLKERLAELQPALEAGEARLRELALALPNPPAPEVPDGGEADGEVLRVVGEPTPAPSLDHAAYGERMGFVDKESAAAIAGSRFHYLLREAVLLELALVQWAMTRLVEHDFVPVLPPVLVREQAMEAAGFFPTDRNQVYEVDGGELFLVGTSEISLAALHRDQILEGELPLRYGGFSTCFRREAGTYGKDTRGIFRVHQFDKVEMFSFAHPEWSGEEHEALLAVQESLVSELGLPYRVVNIAAGDLGAPAAKKYDIEVWLPSEGRYRELTSCSNYTDYSARRLATRVRDDSGRTRLVHTLNGTACAVGRTLLFLFEHGQEPDGAFVVPEALRPFCGLEGIKPRD